MAQRKDSKKTRALLLVAACEVFALCSMFLAVAAAASGAPLVSGCPVFPADHIWNTRIDTLPADPMSDAYVATIGAEDRIHADFGSGIWDGGPIGIPFDVVDENQPSVSVPFLYDDESDPGPYPIPANASIEGGDNADGDRHVLLVDKDACILYELYRAFPVSGAGWEADSGAVYDLTGYELRDDGWTSADAAGLPILPGLVRYEEVAAGEIRHALRFTAPQTRQAYVWPARHFASSLTDTAYPPMGQRFRLKRNVDISGFSAQAKVILQALKTYGMILADNGSRWFISGEPNEAWHNDVLHEMDVITGADFEAVNVSALMISPDSGKARQPEPLADAVRILQLLAGAPNAEAPLMGDLDGDGLLGLAEAIFGLQSAADLR